MESSWRMNVFDLGIGVDPTPTGPVYPVLAAEHTNQAGVFLASAYFPGTKWVQNMANFADLGDDRGYVRLQDWQGIFGHFPYGYSVKPDRLT